MLPKGVAAVFEHRPTDKVPIYQGMVLIACRVHRPGA